MNLRLITVTPILGGGCRPRFVDESDPIRAPSIRGHLRFWWRALRPSGVAGLVEVEREIWGGLGKSGSTRSQVGVRVGDVKPTGIDRADVLPTGEDAYALWPARKTRTGPPAERWKTGLTFNLTVECPRSLQDDIRDVVRAWILFGGYGSRTRRGLGSLALLEMNDAPDWLPSVGELRSQLTGLFRRDLFATPAGARTDMPQLGGAWMAVGCPQNAQRSWLLALEALRSFRQGVDSGAREPPPDPRAVGMAARPGRSNWPESDKVRHLAGRGPWAHDPARHNRQPAWPRAGFGLPIIGQFQRLSRKSAPHNPREYLRFARPEPGDYALVWRREKAVYERLASPLTLKALPLADGSFLPCALWLRRAYPTGGEICVRFTNDKDRVFGAADFDRLVAPGDEVHFEVLRQHADSVQGQRLRNAFMTWLVEHRGFSSVT